MVCLKLYCAETDCEMSLQVISYLPSVKQKGRFAMNRPFFVTRVAGASGAIL